MDWLVDFLQWWTTDRAGAAAAVAAAVMAVVGGAVAIKTLGQARPTAKRGRGR